MTSKEIIELFALIFALGFVIWSLLHFHKWKKFHVDGINTYRECNKCGKQQIDIGEGEWQTLDHYQRNVFELKRKGK